jgi:hypothetical protein
MEDRKVNQVLFGAGMKGGRDGKWRGLRGENKVDILCISVQK